MNSVYSLYFLLLCLLRRSEHLHKQVCQGTLRKRQIIIIQELHLYTHLHGLYHFEKQSYSRGALSSFE